LGVPRNGIVGAYDPGVYDLSQNEGWVSVGIDHDTAQFAVHTAALGKISPRLLGITRPVRLCVSAHDLEVIAIGRMS
jgi:hypothetical protein